MHGFDFSIPHFITSVQGTRIVVTPQIVTDVLRVPKVEFPDYPGCDLLKTVSKEELISAFCEHPFDWGKRQFTYCLGFVKISRFLNMVMTFVLHPLSHFILSLIDVYRDIATRDKFIFPSAITRLLRHFEVRFPSFELFDVMGAIDAGIVKRNETQFCSRRSDIAAPPTPFVPSTSAPSSSTSTVTLQDIMTQLQRMDARLNTLSDELCQVNTRVGRIARRQAEMGGYTVPSTLVAFMDESDGSGSADHAEDDDDATASDDEDDGDASSSSTDEMST